MKRKYFNGPQKIGDIDIIKTLSALDENGIILQILDLIKKHLLVENCNCAFITKDKEINIGLIAIIFIALEMDVKIDRAEHICALCDNYRICSFPKRN